MGKQDLAGHRSVYAQKHMQKDCLNSNFLIEQVQIMYYIMFYFKSLSTLRKIIKGMNENR